jgi:hypothetical protein
LINNANEAGKGRYSTIFDDGYFKDAAEHLPLSSWGYRWTYMLIGHKVDLSPLHLQVL